jgi:FtsP/CotA-like multicopper oxidase with cupredoxin domain
MVDRAVLSRRRFLVGAGASVVIAACGGGSSTPRGSPVGPGDRPVADAEDRRIRPGATVTRRQLKAGLVTVDLAGVAVSTWGYNGQIAGPEIRLRAGDSLVVPFENQLPEATTIHWHGLTVRNDMDGVDVLTQAPVEPMHTFDYRFTVVHPGTYWFHPHMSLQLDRGLYAPLIVEDPAEPLQYDVDIVVLLDDWLDGVDGTPEQAFERLRSMGGMDHGSMSSSADAAGEMAGMARSDVLGGDASDLTYPLYLLNGRPPADRPTVDVQAGGRVRLRLVNAASDTAFRVALGGHRLTVTHADGFPVQPVEVDAVLLGMGERYDVLVTVTSGSWPLVAVAEGRPDGAAAVIRTTDVLGATAPPADARLSELSGRLLAYADLRPTDAVRLSPPAKRRRVKLELTGNMMTYRWQIDGKQYPDHDPVAVTEGEWLQLDLVNRSSMWHPMHLHGHTFQVGADPGGFRKDTVNVLPNQTVPIVFQADNPGQWMLHCHNTYHLETGMATVVSYVR